MLVNSTNATIKDILNVYCSRSKIIVLISSCVLMIKIFLVLPLCVSVLYLGHRRWRQQRSFSHSDVFTYSLSLIELVWAVGLVCYVYGSFSGSTAMLLVGMSSCSSIFYGKMMIHVLTCVDRYLAVVHPVTYLMFRNQRGVRIRNVSMGCVWLLCCVMISLKNFLTDISTYILMSCFMAVSVVVITFCCFAVLRALLRSGPGEGGREKVDQTKLRAFYTIAAISSVLWLWFVALLCCFTVIVSVLNESEVCDVIASLNCQSIPASLVAPVLYLHRAGKLPCSCFNRGLEDPLSLGVSGPVTALLGCTPLL